MTIPEVDRMGQLRFFSSVRPDHRFKCDLDDPLMKVGAQLVKPDGTRFRLTFDLVTQGGDSATMYRLHFIAVEVPGGTPAQIGELLGTLQGRFGTTVKLNQQTWTRPLKQGDAFHLFVAMTAPGQYDAGSAPTVVLMAEYRQKAQWLMSLPVCQQGMPKL